MECIKSTSFSRKSNKEAPLTPISVVQRKVHPERAFICPRKVDKFESRIASLIASDQHLIRRRSQFLIFVYDLRRDKRLAVAYQDSTTLPALGIVSTHNTNDGNNNFYLIASLANDFRASRGDFKLLYCMTRYLFMAHN